jgi:hypothetical protein
LQNPFFAAGQFQNYLLQSEVFDNASWVKTAMGTVTGNLARDPMGTATADYIPFTGNSTGHISQSVTNSVTGYWTFSVWLKTMS